MKARSSFFMGIKILPESYRHELRTFIPIYHAAAERNDDGGCRAPD